MRLDKCEAPCVAIAPDGRVFLAGRLAYGMVDYVPSDLIVAALNRDGSLLRSFADEGKLLTDFDTEDDYRGDDALFRDGKLMVLGSRIVFDDDSLRYYEAESDMFVARFLID